MSDQGGAGYIAETGVVHEILPGFEAGLAVHFLDSPERGDGSYRAVGAEVHALIRF